MATATRKCKECGREYEYCHTAKRSAGIFRWQDVACCPEHGSAYFAKVVASRTEQTENDKSEQFIDFVEEEYDDDDHDDELFEEDSDDEPEETAI